MIILPIESIIVSNRQRKNIPGASIRELADSIKSIGLLQCPGVWTNEKGGYELIWGERRLRAISLLAEEKTPFKYGDKTIFPGNIPALVADLALLTDRKTAEFEENTQRLEMDWTERVAALAEIHLLRKEQNEKQTITDTANELAAKTGLGAETFKKTPKQGVAGTGQNSIPLALFVAPHLNDPEVKRANSAQAAFEIVARRTQARLESAIVSQRLKLGAKLDQELRFGDAALLFKDIPDQSVDLILADPPYGVDSDSANFSKRQTQKHTYNDSPEHARQGYEMLMREAWRVAKPRANIFIFVDWKMYDFVHGLATRMLWTPFTSPVVWDKISPPGIGPWHNEGFGYIYELILFATKGRKGLNAGGGVGNILHHKRESTESRIHGAQKPVSLLKQLIELSTLTGDLVLDPFAGSASTLVAAKELKRRAIGFENDQSVYEMGLVNLHGAKHV